MDQVKKLIRAGAPIPEAIRIALKPITLVELAEKHDLPRAAVSNQLNGNVRATDSTVAALVAELGGTPTEWEELLSLARAVEYEWARERLAEMVGASETATA